MQGKHGYRRMDARKALSQGLAGKLPASWRHAEENAAVEIWLTIDGATAICGLRLSDRGMRHRTYKEAHQKASLRPTLAAAMVRLAEIQPRQTVLDPMCGAGTILAEVFAGAGRASGMVLGGDYESASLRGTKVNLQGMGQAVLIRWDARHLPLPDHHIERVISNPPFGVQLKRPEEIAPLYRRMAVELQRVVKPGGRLVLLVADDAALLDAAQAVAWKELRRLRVRVLGQRATVFVFRTASPVR